MGMLTVPSYIDFARVLEMYPGECIQRDIFMVRGSLIFHLTDKLIFYPLSFLSPIDSLSRRGENAADFWKPGTTRWNRVHTVLLQLTQAIATILLS